MFLFLLVVDNFDIVNKTAIDEVQRKWKVIEVFFDDFFIENAQEFCDRIRRDLKNAQEDLPRRWALIERLMIEIEEQENQKKEEQEGQKKDQDT